MERQAVSVPQINPLMRPLHSWAQPVHQPPFGGLTCLQAMWHEMGVPPRMVHESQGRRLLIRPVEAPEVPSPSSHPESCLHVNPTGVRNRTAPWKDASCGWQTQALSRKKKEYLGPLIQKPDLCPGGLGLKQWGMGAGRAGQTEEAGGAPGYTAIGMPG